MKAHIVEKTYSNGASAIEEVFTSYKAAWDYLDRYAEASRKDGFNVDIVTETYYGRMYKMTHHSSQVECFRVVSMEMRKY